MLKIVPLLAMVGLLLLVTACGAADTPPPTTAVAADTPTATTASTNTPMPDTPTDTPVVETATEEPTNVAEVVVEETEEAEDPTPTLEPTAAPTEEIDWRTIEGKTEDNLTYLGNPDAPVTILDYSDFL